MRTEKVRSIREREREREFFLSFRVHSIEFGNQNTKERKQSEGREERERKKEPKKMEERNIFRRFSLSWFLSFFPFLLFLSLPFLIVFLSFSFPLYFFLFLSFFFTSIRNKRMMHAKESVDASFCINNNFQGKRIGKKLSLSLSLSRTFPLSLSDTDSEEETHGRERVRTCDREDSSHQMSRNEKRKILHPKRRKKYGRKRATDS